MSQAGRTENQTTPLEERLTVDPVTGLRNEYLFRLRLPDEFFSAREREANGAFLAIKLDNIIEINARHGRSGGDEALRSLAHLLHNFQSAPDNSSHLLFKLGGPVFGYFIPVCSAEKSRTVAEAVYQQVIQSEQFLEKITVSIGIVNLYEFFLNEGDVRQIALLIEQTAFVRLQIAEKKGMNTICDTSGIADSAQGARTAVLVVDPDPTSIDLLLHALQSQDIEVRTCRDGETALSLIQENAPDVVVCEVMTPRLNGFTIRERLRANALWNNIQFILISHKKNEELIRKAVDRDIRYFFQKPFSVMEVRGLITNLMKGTNK